MFVVCFSLSLCKRIQIFLYGKKKKVEGRRRVLLYTFACISLFGSSTPFISYSCSAFEFFITHHDGEMGKDNVKEQKRQRATFFLGKFVRARTKKGKKTRTMGELECVFRQCFDRAKKKRKKKRVVGDSTRKKGNDKTKQQKLFQEKPASNM